MGTISFAKIPVELVEEIVQLTSTTDQLALCITSKSLNAVAIRYLYRCITLRSSIRIVQCCRTLKNNASTALAARSLYIIISQSENPAFLLAYYKVIGDALASTVRLRSLGLFFFTMLHPIVLDKCNFPRLRDFKLSVPFMQPIASFLLRHPNLQKLYFISPCGGYTPDNFVSISLPALTCFGGPASLIPTLLVNCAVKHVNILWPARDNDYENIIASLNSASIYSLDNTTLGWILPLAQAISRHCPMVTSLKFRNGFPLEERFTTKDFVTALSDILPLFKNLQDITLTRLVNVYGHATMADLDTEFETVVHWGRLCPSLLMCVLPSGIAWYRIRACAWFPHGSHPQREKWLVEVLRAGKYPAVDILIKTLEHSKPALDALLSIIDSSSNQVSQRSAGEDNDTDDETSDEEYPVDW